jgi:hypothetical protein
VDLHADAVELELHGRGPDPLERRVEVVARRGEHRLHGSQQLERDPAQARGAVGERDRGHGAEVAPQHHCALHVGARQVGRLGHRVGHHAGQRALADVAEQQRGQEPLLGLGRPREQVAHGVAARRLRAGAGQRSHARERVLDVGHGQRLPRSGRRRVSQSGPADADLPLGQHARQPGHGGRRLGGLEPAQEIGQDGDLATAR